MIKKTYIFLLIGFFSLAHGTNLDNFFSNDNVDITDTVITEKKVLERKVEALEKENKLQKMEIGNRFVKQGDLAPTVYFKQPKLYTIYTREELRSWGDIDVVFNSGWKTIIVGKHRLILNNEMKIK